MTELEIGVSSLSVTHNFSRRTRDKRLNRAFLRNLRVRSKPLHESEEHKGITIL